MFEITTDDGQSFVLLEDEDLEEEEDEEEEFEDIEFEDAEIYIDEDGNEYVVPDDAPIELDYYYFE